MHAIDLIYECATFSAYFIGFQWIVKIDSISKESSSRENHKVLNIRTNVFRILSPFIIRMNLLLWCFDFARCTYILPCASWELHYYHIVYYICYVRVQECYQRSANFSFNVGNNHNQWNRATQPYNCAIRWTLTVTIVD